MRKTIEKALKETGVSVYSIEETTTESAELFFILKQLDVRRMKKVTSYRVAVYRDFEEDGRKFRGNSEIVVNPGTTEEELKRELGKAFESAKNTKNPYYELYKGTTEAPAEDRSSLASVSLPDAAALFAKAAFEADVDPEAFLNSLEVFAERRTVRFVSSLGFENGYKKSVVKGEFVTQCKAGQDVEQYFGFEYADCCPEELTEKVKKALQTVKDRAKATEAPKSGSYDVILSGENVRQLMNAYLYKCATALVFPHYSDAEVGKPIQGEALDGEALNLSVVPSVPYSEEGIPMKERKLLENGVVGFLHGSSRFASYMGLEPTGVYRRVKLENGTVPFDEMKKGCLYPVTFSDFSMNPITGDFGGEMRLAYYFDGEEVKILTGGSINASIVEKQGDLTFSLERYKDASYEGPLAVKLRNVAVAGK